MLSLPDAWLWDFWLADTGSDYHLFYLKASRALHDPERRHRRASVGHAVSADLRQWRELDDALVAGPQPSWDDLATWTGSVVDAGDGRWQMFYTGCSRAEDGRVQRIGRATSTDVLTWTRSEEPLCVADPQWYDAAFDAQTGEVHWRDPWVFADPDGDGWHMLVTAKSLTGATDDRGVIGHAWSADLESWEVRPPLSRPGSGFSQLEVSQTLVVDGRPVLLFSCLGPELSAAFRARHQVGGTWAVACDDVRGPFDIAQAQLLFDDAFYSARLVRDRAGSWQALAFHNREPDGSFGGRLSDPMPVGWVRPGVLGRLD